MQFRVASPKSNLHRRNQQFNTTTMNEHRSDIKHNRNKPVAENFNKPNYALENLRLAVIKKVKSTIRQQQKVEEQKIIFKFDCVNKGLKL